MRPATAADNEKAINAHDKAYVQPAEQVEKSYQMMNQAYNEYQAAAAQGKDLPTGAQSMVALSTHLATTFGNVKGSTDAPKTLSKNISGRVPCLTRLQSQFRNSQTGMYSARRSGPHSMT